MPKATPQIDRKIAPNPAISLEPPTLPYTHHYSDDRGWVYIETEGETSKLKTIRRPRDIWKHYYPVANQLPEMHDVTKFVRKEIEILYGDKRYTMYARNVPDDVIEYLIAKTRANYPTVVRFPDDWALKHLVALELQTQRLVSKLRLARQDLAEERLERSAQAVEDDASDWDELSFSLSEDEDEPVERKACKMKPRRNSHQDNTPVQPNNNAQEPHNTHTKRSRNRPDKRQKQAHSLKSTRDSNQGNTFAQPDHDISEHGRAHLQRGSTSRQVDYRYLERGRSGSQRDDIESDSGASASAYEDSGSELAEDYIPDDVSDDELGDGSRKRRRATKLKA
ncbi:unnamed protein product [Rhizoctonia solani]|uniref:Uncharacterized protein n=1 Tax=Rhizoctonia solani TaxID=456999 RepID=A0A8H3HWC8_9AGAM|nr:unnamed protein product [Rhizoctonia solani]CAE7098653.1 unnamed protein product [Rhizoctonia solani]